MPWTSSRCRNARRHLSGFLDGQLNHRARWRIRYHLMECEPCRAELARLEALATRLAGLKSPPAPVGLWDRIARSAGDRPSPAARSDAEWPGPWRVPPGIAAAAGFLLTAVLLGQFDRPPGEPDLLAAPPGPEERVVDEVDYGIWYFHGKNAVRDRTGLVTGPREESMEEILERLVERGEVEEEDER